MRSFRSMALYGLVLASAAWLPVEGFGKELPTMQVSREMREAAIDFLGTLDERLKEQVRFDFEGSERTDWHFIPKERVGVSFKEMNLIQRRAARVLMRSVLSEKGYLKATTIMSLEQVLRLLEADRENVEQIRDQEKYWFAVFGDPAGEQPWGWRVEGHHLSLNFSSVDRLVAGTTPIFFGANPAEVRIGPRMGLRTLGDEEDQAREFMAALDVNQRGQAIISEEAPGDVLTVPGAALEIGKPAGIAAESLNDAQRQLLEEMVRSFLHHLRAALAETEIAAVEQAGMEKIHFAWAGSLEPDKNHYFRLHGPTFILEYDNAQGNHAHVVWHSLRNDFGADVLRRHYEESPHHHGEAGQ